MVRNGLLNIAVLYAWSNWPPLPSPRLMKRLTLPVPCFTGQDIQKRHRKGQPGATKSPVRAAPAGNPVNKCISASRGVYERD